MGFSPWPFLHHILPAPLPPEAPTRRAIVKIGWTDSASTHTLHHSICLATFPRSRTPCPQSASQPAAFVGQCSFLLSLSGRVSQAYENTAWVAAAAIYLSSYGRQIVVLVAIYLYLLLLLGRCRTLSRLLASYFLSPLSLPFHHRVIVIIDARFPPFFTYLTYSLLSLLTVSLYDSDYRYAVSCLHELEARAAINNRCVHANSDGLKVVMMLQKIPFVAVMMSRDDSMDDCRVENFLYRDHVYSQLRVAKVLMTAGWIQVATTTLFIATTTLATVIDQGGNPSSSEKHYS